MEGSSCLSVDDSSIAMKLQLEEIAASEAQSELVHEIVSNTIASAPDSLSSLEQEHTKTSSNVDFNCPICLERRPISSSRVLGDCNEQFCDSCILQYLTIAVHEERRYPIPCPLCSKAFDSEKCLNALSGTDAYNILDELIVEKTCFSRLRYCVNPKCGVAFDWIEDDSLEGFADASKVTCPLCAVESCANCKTEWHANQTCAQYQANRKDTDSLAKLAEQNKWMPCPRCSELIERRLGDCNFMKCRCGTAFCHNCGVAYLSRERTSNNSHGRPGCRCGLWRSQSNPEQRQRLLRSAIEASNRNPQQQTGHQGRRPVTQEAVFVGHFCRHALKTIARLMESQLGRQIMQDALKSHIKSLWTKWTAGKITKNDLFDSVAEFVRTSCPEAKNVNVIRDFKEWYQSELDTQRKASESAAGSCAGGNRQLAGPSPPQAQHPPQQHRMQEQPQPSQAVRGTVTQEQIIIGHFCRHALKTQTELMKTHPDCQRMQDALKTHIKSSWTQWLAGAIAKGELLNSIAQFVRTSCPEASNVNVISEFRQWYHAQLDAQRRAKFFSAAASSSAVASSAPHEPRNQVN